MKILNFSVYYTCAMNNEKEKDNSTRRPKVGVVV
jgi:hypothetical protein